MKLSSRWAQPERVVIASPCEYELFYKIGFIVENLGACYTQRIMDLNNLYWSFIYAGQRFVLHYDIYTGAYICPAQQGFSEDKFLMATQIAKSVNSALEESYAR